MKTTLLLSKIAGYTWIICGVVHLLIGITFSLPIWQQIAGAGFWNTATPIWGEGSSEMVQRIFWTIPASFGIPLALLGALVVWTTAQKRTLPHSLGWVALPYTMFVCVLCPKSGFWIALIGALLLVMASFRATEHSAQVK